MLGPQKAGGPGHFINVWCSGKQSMVLLQLKDPLELIVKRREFLKVQVYAGSPKSRLAWSLYKCVV